MGTVEGGGNSLSSKSRDSVNHARGIVNIGTLNIETGYRQDLQGWRKGILNFLSFLFSLSLSFESILTRYETRRLRFPFLFHREIHRYRLYLIDRAESEFRDVLTEKKGGGVINITWIRAIICHWNPVHFSSPVEDLWPGFHIVLFLSIRQRSVWMYIEKWKKC